MTPGGGSAIYSAIGVIGIILGLVKEIAIIAILFQGIRFMSYIMKNNCFEKLNKDSSDEDLSREVFDSSEED